MAGKPSSDKITPGIALKFLRDGIDSANLVAMERISGQEGYNFFEKEFSNFLPSESSFIS